VSRTPLAARAAASNDAQAASSNATRRFRSAGESPSSSDLAFEPGTPNSVPLSPAGRSTTSTPRTVAGGEKAIFARVATLA